MVGWSLSKTAKIVALAATLIDSKPIRPTVEETRHETLDASHIRIEVAK